MLQQVNLIGRARCECHECTQARWNMRAEPLNYQYAGLATSGTAQTPEEWAKAQQAAQQTAARSY